MISVHTFITIDYITTTMYLHYNVPPLQCPSTTMSLHYNVPPLQCISTTMYLHYNVRPLQCPSTTMSLHYNVPPLQCISTTMYLHYNVRPLQCPSTTMSLSYNTPLNDIMLRCYRATNPDFANHYLCVVSPVDVDGFPHLVNKHVGTSGLHN